MVLVKHGWPMVWGPFSNDPKPRGQLYGGGHFMAAYVHLPSRVPTSWRNVATNERSRPSTLNRPYMVSNRNGSLHFRHFVAAVAVLGPLPHSITQKSTVSKDSGPLKKWRDLNSGLAVEQGTSIDDPS